MQKNKILAMAIAILFAIGMSACAGEKVPGESNIPSQSHSSSIDSEITPDDSVETDSSSDDSEDSSSEDSSEETWTGIYKP